MKTYKFLKHKKSLLILGLTAISGAAVLASSCAAQPATSSVDNLFKPSNRFGDDKMGLSVNSLVTNVLSQTDAFNTFLDTVMGNVLLSFYENNPIKSLKDKYDSWKNDVDKMWNDQIQTMKDQYRNNYLLNLQIGPLDSNGGTEAAWKQNEFNKKALEEFKSSVFAKTYLNYTDENGDVITKPDETVLTTQANWTKIKYTNQHNKVKYVDNSTDTLTNTNNNEQMYADIQDFMATQWVKEENPNLLSRVVLTNETPKVGFNSIFNSDLNSSISASYEFQVFNPYNELDISKTPANSWKELVEGTKGLNKYLNDNGTIDIPSHLSSDAGGKLLMSAYDMFNTYDALFSAAYVNQYLNLLDSSYATNYLPNAHEIKPTDNIMNVFIRKTDPSGEKGARTLDYVNQKESGDSRKLFATNAATIANGAYKNYVDLEADNSTQTTTPSIKATQQTENNTSNRTSIFDIGFQKMPTTSSKDGDVVNAANGTTNNQFMLSRGADGIHVIGIDGGSYYISGTNGTKTRDINKQKAFLLFRTLYKQLGYAKTDYDYTFDATTQIQNLFNKSPSLYLYQAFSTALNDKSSFLYLSSNAKLKDSFQKAHDTIDACVQALFKKSLLNKIETAIKTVQDKFLSKADTYVKNDLDNASAKNGIAGSIPNQQAIDGSIPTLEYYYQKLAAENGIVNSTTDVSNITTEGVKKFFVDLHNKVNDDVNTVVNAFVASLNLTIEPSPTYSQVIFLKANGNDFYTLAINLALSKGIANPNVTNAVKANYFKNNSSFKNFYDFTTGNIIFKSTDTNADPLIATRIKEIANYYYAEKILNTSSVSKFSYGVPKTDSIAANQGSSKDLKTNDSGFVSYKGVLQNVLDSKNFIKDSSSEDAINYFTYLYTFEWLIRNDLQNLKTILNASIPAGTSSMVAWTVPIAADTPTTELDSKNPLTTFPTNPNYYWGSNSNWMNSVNAPGKADKSNKLELPYRATFEIASGASKNSTITYSNIGYGFTSLITEGSTKIDTALNQALFANFGHSKKTNENVSTGALYAFGSSRDEVVNYIQMNLSTNQDLNNFINFLIQNVGISITDPNLSTSNLNVDTKKAALISLVQKTPTTSGNKTTTTEIPDNAFSCYMGYIGTSKADKLSESKPIISADGSQLLPTYIKQVNNSDIQKLGKGWLAAPSTTSIANQQNASNDHRLGLNLDEFLSIVAIQALDSGTQSSALTNLINSNMRTDTDSGPTLVGDKRLLDALTSRWAAAINQPKK
ncbi:DUF3713 domain-containing protein [Mycoplasmoides alvi]|uniref:DUF3713 domain-containing protein n=1 Tax=Mycoplasmoides alvi TaxID=78580 RepID=UPI00051B4FF0|nr:DUF3713 domain-containing protein [Mycoplasmoides alvi]